MFNEVDDICHFSNHPWDRLSWKTIFDSLDNALTGRDEKFKNSQLEKTSHKIEKYNIYGFTFGV